MARSFGDIAFTPAVKELQERHGSRRQYERMQTMGEPHDKLGAFEQAFLAERDTFYLATVGSNGWPYIQHRGGPKGFLKVIDDHTLAFADFAGNKQYISTGNLATDDRVAIILIDYPQQARLKVLGHAEVLEGEAAAAYASKTSVGAYPARVERVFLIHLEAFDWNCPQHIKPRYTMEEIREMVQPVNTRVEALEKENAALRKEIDELRKK